MKAARHRGREIHVFIPLAPMIYGCQDTPISVKRVFLQVLGETYDENGLSI